MTAWPRVVASRVALVLLGVCISLVVAEAALQLGSLFVGRELARTWAQAGRWRMLCLGDSNTYGVYLERSQAYPQVFEREWNTDPQHQEQKVEVLNLGYPGTSSSKLVKDFRHMLHTFRPDVTTVMVGANDLWTVPETAADSPGLSDRLAAALWKISKVYRLLYMIRRSMQVRQLQLSRPPAATDQGRGFARYGDEVFEFGWTMQPEGGVSGWQPVDAFRQDLHTLVEQAAEFGTKLVFLTYPADAGFYGWANVYVREAARVTGTALIDLAAALKPRCPIPSGSTFLEGPGATCPELFPDQHPTALGHERVATILVEQLTPELD